MGDPARADPALIEDFHWMDDPQWGAAGSYLHVEANYLQSWLLQDNWGDWRKTPGFLWRLSSRHGSKGVLGDIGVHIVDFATYPAGPAPITTTSKFSAIEIILQ